MKLSLAYLKITSSHQTKFGKESDWRWWHARSALRLTINLLSSEGTNSQRILRSHVYQNSTVLDLPAELLPISWTVWLFLHLCRSHWTPRKFSIVTFYDTQTVFPHQIYGHVASISGFVMLDVNIWDLFPDLANWYVAIEEPVSLCFDLSHQLETKNYQNQTLCVCNSPNCVPVSSNIDDSTRSHSRPKWRAMHTYVVFMVPGSGCCTV